MTILVIGATGRVAGQVFGQLLSRKAHPRALVRNGVKAEQMFGVPANAGYEMVVGAFDDTDLLRAAFAGAEVAFLALGTSQVQIAREKQLIEEAARNGTHVVRLSVFDADPKADTEVTRRHGELDDFLVSD